MTLQKGDILGHEFMGVVDRIGPNVTNLQIGQRVVASFQIACGDCSFCKQKLSSFCDRTNSSSWVCSLSLYHLVLTKRSDL
jgi:threonine dehydrogenase-like Zn-dependent dehydrogenase